MLCLLRRRRAVRDGRNDLAQLLFPHVACGKNARQAGPRRLVRAVIAVRRPAELLAAEGFGLPLRRPEETAAEAARCIQSGTEPLRRAALDAFAAHFSSSQAEAACTEVLAALLRPAEEA